MTLVKFINIHNRMKKYLIALGIAIPLAAATVVALDYPSISPSDAPVSGRIVQLFEAMLVSSDLSSNDGTVKAAQKIST